MTNLQELELPVCITACSGANGGAAVGDIGDSAVTDAEPGTEVCNGLSGCNVGNTGADVAGRYGDLLVGVFPPLLDDTLDPGLCSSPLVLGLLPPLPGFRASGTVPLS